MGIVGADFDTGYIIHFERPSSSAANHQTPAFRVGRKRLAQSMCSGGEDSMTLKYYEYDVYCQDPNVLVGQILQASLVNEMKGPECTRAGGLCHMLTLHLHPGMSVEYRGHMIPLQEAQFLKIGDLLSVPGETSSLFSSSSPKKIRVVGTMDVFACLPCCCTIPKLLNPELLPWKQYDIFNPEFDFTAAAPKTMTMEHRGTGGAAEAEVVDEVPIAVASLVPESNAEAYPSSSFTAANASSKFSLFPIGTRVQLTGLYSADGKDLNGKIGVVRSEVGPDGRQNVVLEGGGRRTVAIKPSNLMSAPGSFLPVD